MEENARRGRPLLLAAVAGALIAASCTRDPNVLKRKYLESGDGLVAKKNYADAIIQYRRAIAEDGSFGEARLKLAGAYESTGDVRNALPQAIRAADLMPDKVIAQTYAAKLLLAAGQFPEAKARALAALAKDPKNLDGLIFLGNALAGMKDVEGAISQVEQAIDAQPRVEFGYTNLGLLHLQKGNSSAAEMAFKRAIVIAPTSVIARLNLGSFYWAGGDLSAAERELKMAVALDAKSPDANRMLAVFYQTNHRRTEAEPYLKAYAAATSAVTPKLALADFYLASDRSKDAADVLELLAKDKDGFGPAKLRLAAIDFRAGRRQQAYQTIEEVLKLFPKTLQTLETKTRFLLEDRKFDEAIKITNSVVAAEPRATTSHFLRGLALASRGSTDEAIKAMQRVLELAPAAMPAQLELAKLYLTRRDTKSAIDLLNPLIKAQPRMAVLHLLMGQGLLEAGDLPGAETHLVPAASAMPASAEPQILLGRLYGAKADLARARRAFGRALELQPSSAVALNGLVTLDVVEKRPDAARALLESRLAATPNDEALLFLAGNFYLTIGDAERAEPLFRKVLQLNPANFEAYARLGRLYWSQNRLDQAKTEYEEAARRQAKPVAPKTLIGMILELENRPDEARKQYEEALAINPRAAVAANNLALHYAERGNLDIALELAQTAKSTLPDNASVSDTLGWIYYKKGLVSLALRALQQGAEQDPTNPIIFYHLGLAYQKNGDTKGARESLQRALKLNPSFPNADEAKRVLAVVKG
jgi:tetratricopeptide (TPR) repeat protein